MVIRYSKKVVSKGYKGIDSVVLKEGKNLMDVKGVITCHKSLFFSTAESPQLCYTSHPAVVIGIISVVVDRCEHLYEKVTFGYISQKMAGKTFNFLVTETLHT